MRATRPMAGTPAAVRTTLMSYSPVTIDSTAPMSKISRPEGRTPTTEDLMTSERFLANRQ